MARVLVLSGSNHAFDKCAPLLAEALKERKDLEVAFVEDKAILASPGLNDYDVLVHGTGFTYRERKPDGSVATLPYLSPEQEKGLFGLVKSAKRFVAIH